MPPYKQNSYPWGSQQPPTYLRAVSSKLRMTLDDACARGYRDLFQRSSDSVRASRPVLDVLEYASVSGFRPKRSHDPVPAHDIVKAIAEVRAAVAALGSASIFDVSERYQCFVCAAEALLTLSDQALASGVDATAVSCTHASWNAFES